VNAVAITQPRGTRESTMTLLLTIVGFVLLIVGAELLVLLGIVVASRTLKTPGGGARQYECPRATLLAK
jgi:hypothetical protein